MREQNVKALIKLLRAAGAGTRDPGRLAEWLVETGAVVVPGAITDEEAMDLLHNRPEEPLGAIEDMDGEWLRECLRRIATTPATPVGEPDRSPKWLAPGRCVPVCRVRRTGCSDPDSDRPCWPWSQPQPG